MELQPAPYPINHRPILSFSGRQFTIEMDGGKMITSAIAFIEALMTSLAPHVWWLVAVGGIFLGLLIIRPTKDRNGVRINRQIFYPAASEAQMEADRLYQDATVWKLRKGENLPLLPLPTKSDQAYAVVLALGENPNNRAYYYRRGVERDDLELAMAGLRFDTQYSLAQSHQDDFMIQSVYQTIAGAYWELGKTFRSKDCLQLARLAFHWALSRSHGDAAAQRTDKSILADLVKLAEDRRALETET
ncbi:hypothetical protein [Asticcacaulis sp. YBE204]|uniref:hypothetical protein n=1 Tax=Asticcacaulis sp. YBE204 TaxID=1282363 RepID=UPI0012DCC948|nr:hypothetical protein [Asticcacaulis sp. YBE204]